MKSLIVWYRFLLWYLIDIATLPYGSFIDFNPNLKIQAHGKDHQIMNSRPPPAHSIQGSPGLVPLWKGGTLERKAINGPFHPTLHCLWWPWLDSWQMYFISTLNKNIFLVCCFRCLHKTSCRRNRKNHISLYTFILFFDGKFSKTSWMLPNKSNQWCSFLFCIKLFSLILFCRNFMLNS